ncbi:homoserine O-acetyltransferase [Litorivicinus sp.]|nr:homoserine O-acetyltransferase [Litorivicinus sp.]
MPKTLGVIKPTLVAFEEPIELSRGGRLSRYDLIVETYGNLNADKSNAVLVCHALSGNHHAAGFYDGETKPGWWDHYIGPEKSIDTDLFFVVSLNNLGGCSGSTGPLSTNPETGEPYGPEFPEITVDDWVHTQARLADSLGIVRFAAVVGGSLGGMQAMQWAINYPERIGAAVIIAAAPRLTAQNIAFNEIARQAIVRDPNFHKGHYNKHGTLPISGVGLARMIGHITYLSDISMGEKFGRDLPRADHDSDGANFAIEQYLRYQGQQFSERFDANTYILMTRALDYFDPMDKKKKGLADLLRPANSKFLVLSFSTDWRFSPSRSEEIVEALVQANRQVSYARLESVHGHDAFLIPNPIYERIFESFMNRLHSELGAINSDQ